MLTSVMISMKSPVYLILNDQFNGQNFSIDIFQFLKNCFKTQPTQLDIFAFIYFLE